MRALHRRTRRAGDQKRSGIKGESLSQQRLLSHALSSAPLRNLLAGFDPALALLF